MDERDLINCNCRESQTSWRPSG